MRKALIRAHLGVPRLSVTPKTPYNAKRKVLNLKIGVNQAWVLNNKQVVDEAEMAREVDILVWKFVRDGLIEVPNNGVSENAFCDLW